MAFQLSFPAYVFVESARTDSTGGTTFTNPLGITFKLASDEQPIIAIPVFTAEAKAVAFRPATDPSSSRWLKLVRPDHLTDFLTKASKSNRATHVVIDPTESSLTTDRLCTIQALVDGFQKFKASNKSP